jgi:TldD protein
VNKRSRRSLVTTAAILALGTSLMVSHGQDGAAITETTVRAMSDELKRSMSDLQVKNLDRPYFIQYIVMDEDEYSSEATFGSLTYATRSQQKYAHVQVRVGSYDSDNTGTVAGAGGARGGGGGARGGGTGTLARTVKDNDYDGLRHSLWLLTDSTYKQAVEAIARKRASLQNRTQNEPVPDFSKETPTVSIGMRQTMDFDRAGLEQKMRDWSRTFKEFPDIQSTYVQVMARLTHRYIVNSEGTQTMQPAMLIAVIAGGSVQASDGMRISSAVPFYARSFDELPAAADVTKAIRQLAADLLAARSAPVLEADYSGPVLVSGPAAADMFGRVLSPNLTGRGGQNGDLLDRLNRPVLPASFSVFDDPSLKRSGDKNLIGYYQIDDQGIPAKRVSLIEDGLFLDLAMGRKPIKERLQSNGHGRSGYPGSETAEISNMVVKVTDGKNLDELKQELIKSARAERLQYGMMLKGPALGSPIQTYKVHIEDGREELVRGATAGGISAGSLRHIQAAGNDSFVSNRLTGMQGAETPLSVVAPSVLLEEMEFKKPSGTQQKPALLTHPDLSRP